MTVATPESTPTAAMPTSLDLDAERSRRAAEREGKSQDLPIVLGGVTIATLPVELPLDVFGPLRQIDDSITLLLRSAIDVWRGGEEAQARWNAAELIINVLAANPTLPSTALDVLAQMGDRLFGKEGFEALMAARLTREDLAYLVGGVMRFYGLTPGESSPSSDSSTEDGGTTLNETSTSSTPDSTSEDSGTPPVAPASLESDASSSS